MAPPDNIDGFLPLVETTDVKQRIQAATDLLSYLKDPEKSIQSTDIGLIIEALVPYIGCSNPKVSQTGLDVLIQLIMRMRNDFRGYVQTILPAVMERMGDVRPSVREACQNLIIIILEYTNVNPAHIFDKLLPCFTNKNINVRHEVLCCLSRAIDLCGVGQRGVQIATLLPIVVKMIGDQSNVVRDAANTALVTMYRHVGDRVRLDIQKKYSANLQPAKLATLMQKFDEIKLSGDFMATANVMEALLEDHTASSNYMTDSLSYPRSSSAGIDEIDRQSTGIAEFARPGTTSKIRRSSSISPDTTPQVPVATSGVPVMQKRISQPVKQATTPASLPLTSRGFKPTNSVIRTNSLRRPDSSGAAGAVDEAYFLKAFDENVDVQLYSARELEDHMTKIKAIVEDQYADWDKRVDAMRTLRGLVSAGATSLDEFHAHLRLLEIPFQAAVKDLRSQVVREACITIAYLSKVLQNKFDHFAEYIIQQIMSLIMNSAKIIASSGLVTVRFILQYVHTPRLIPIIVGHNTSKSKDIRRAVCESIDFMVHSWPTHTLEKHVALIKECIKRGVGDADSDARLLARKAFWGFRQHFREQSDSLLNGVSQTHKKQILSEAPESQMGEVSLMGSLPSTSSGRATGATPRRPHIPTATPRRPAAPSPMPTSVRSNSAIELHAAQRAKARAQYAALSRQKAIALGSGSLPRPRKITPDAGPGSLGVTTERIGRTRAKVAGVSQSQPSSRSGSPSSRLSYTTYAGRSDSSGSLIFDRPRRASGSVPRSTGVSRETSPTRYNLLTFGTKTWNRADRPPAHTSTTHTPQGRPVMAQKMLQQSQEAESAFADALNLEPSDHTDSGCNRMSSRKSSSCRPFEDHSDDSETSSVCSARSFDSFQRPSDSYSWSGSQQRLYRDVWEPTVKDINEIIANCESTHWSDRKEGLIGLQTYLQAENLLEPSELKRVTDNFTKMFMDSHTKVFSLFLDTLNDLIIVHRTDLNSWLYILLTRLLNKLGGDLLGSIQNKILKSLDVVRASFPSDVQMSIVLRFLCDTKQTPNARVKMAACNYITKLAAVTDPSLVFLPASPGQVKDTATAALTKMIGWTMGVDIKQGSELRQAAQEAIIALFNLNTPQVTLRFSLLPKEYQEAAANLIQGRIRRTSVSSSSGIGASTGTGNSPLISPGSPIATSRNNAPAPFTHQALSPTPPPPQHYPSHTDSENLNPEEVYRSLRKTTAEIQNYSYESGGKKLNREETSQDSGISQLSLGEDIRSLTHQSEDMSVSRGQSNRASSAGRILTVRDCNGIDAPDNQSDGFTVGDESEAVRKLVDSLKSPVEEDEPNGQNCLLTDQEKKIALTQLVQLIRESNSLALLDNFKSILRVLLTQLGSSEPNIKMLVLTSLTEMMKKRALADSFNNYVELLVLKVLQAFKDGSKEKEHYSMSSVQKNAEACAATIATLLAPELVIRVLVPLITTGDYPVNLGAIKTLTKLIETRGPEPVQNYLSELMPGLIQAYDNNESSVRKSAVFCMVALHTTVSEEQLQPHLSSLNGSKLKLLHLYIIRAQQGSSVPTSPKNQPSSS